MAKKVRNSTYKSHSLQVFTTNHLITHTGEGKNKSRLILSKQEHVHKSMIGHQLVVVVTDSKFSCRSKFNQTLNARGLTDACLVNWVLINLTRCVVSRKQKQREKSAGHEDCIKPSMIEIKLNISAQYICYYPSAPTKTASVIIIQFSIF